MINFSVSPLQKTKEYGVVFLIGAAGYVLLELLWRGHSHWTMAFTGGLCFFLVYLINKKLSSKHLFRRCFWGALTISVVEFAVGMIVNVWLGWRVWDYSNLQPNFLGQISLMYCGLWFLLCIPLNYFSRFVYRRLNKITIYISR